MAQKPQQQAQYETSGLSFFQLAAVQLNVRYSAGVSFPPTAPNTIASIWYQSLAQHGAHNQIALARLPDDPTKARPIIARQPVNLGAPGSSQKLSFPPPVIAKLDGRALQDVLTTNTFSSDVAATGPAKLFIFLTATDEASCFVVNVCAALWDATTIKAILHSFMGSLDRLKKSEMGVTFPPQTAIKNVYTKLGGWDQFMPKAPEVVPEYLPIGSPEVPQPKITDILKGDPAAGKARRVSTTIDADIVTSCRQILEARGGGQATLSGLCAACFARALAEHYFKENTGAASEVTIVQSTQIDPRTMLVSTDEINYIHAVGTLTHGCSVTKDEIESASAAEWLIEETKRSEADVQARMKRGEGIKKSMQLFSGNIDMSKHIEVCMEIVDHGQYDTPSDEYEIELGHRLDICPHMSLVVHTENASGKMKVEAQIAKEQGLEATVKLFERCEELLRELAATK